jgi:ribonuclease I
MIDNVITQKIVQYIRNSIKKLENDRMQLDSKIQILREIEICIELEKW